MGAKGSKELLVKPAPLFANVQAAWKVEDGTSGVISLLAL